MTTNTFSLTIETDNEAFQEFDNGEIEVARILRDANGNTVGEAGFGR